MIKAGYDQKLVLKSEYIGRDLRPRDLVEASSNAASGLSVKLNAGRTVLSELGASSVWGMSGFSEAVWSISRMAGSSCSGLGVAEIWKSSRIFKAFSSAFGAGTRPSSFARWIEQHQQRLVAHSPYQPS